MPKITLTESQKYKDRLRKNIKLMQGQKNSDDMAKILGVSKSTYLNRLKHPDKLTLNETRLLCNYFKVSMSKFISDELTLQ